LVGKEYTDWNSNDEYVVDKINRHINSIHGNEMFKNEPNDTNDGSKDTFNVIADSHDNVIDNNGILDLTVPEYILYDSIYYILYITLDALGHKCQWKFKSLLQ
jgi:hypothetical protein